MSAIPTPHLPNAPLTIAVVGMGYVGLPLAVAATARGSSVIGYDINPSRVTSLAAGSSHVEDVSGDELAAALHAGARFTSDPAALSEADAVLIAVPSPLNRSRLPDMSYIEDAARTVATHARRGQLVSLESTTYPGTTEEIVVPALEREGFRLDEDVHVCFSPERVDPGNTLTTGTIPKVVGGVTPASTAVGEYVYRQIVDRVHTVTSARAAELTKLLENTYRAVNIALVNEIAQVACSLDVDIWEVVDAAATKPFGFQPFYPGPGVGGHCIPLDPQFLAFRARELHAPTRFIDVAEDVNRGMPDYVTRRVADLLNRQGRSVSGSTILGVGVAYKPNVSDDRESPAHDVLGRLKEAGAEISVVDPHVPDDRLVACGYKPHEPQSSTYDVAIVLTDHAVIDYADVAAAATVVFDTRGVYRAGCGAPANVVAL